PSSRSASASRAARTRDRSRAWCPGSGGRGSAARGRGRLASVPPERRAEDERIERDIGALTMQRGGAPANHLHELIAHPRRLHGAGVAFVLERKHVHCLHEIVVEREDWGGSAV